MAAIVLTIILALFLSAAVWFVVGSRFRFNPDDEMNQLLNFVAIFLAAIPVSFVIIFFGIG